MGKLSPLCFYLRDNNKMITFTAHFFYYRNANTLLKDQARRCVEIRLLCFTTAIGKYCILSEQHELQVEIPSQDQTELPQCVNMVDNHFETSKKAQKQLQLYLHAKQ